MTPRELNADERALVQEAGEIIEALYGERVPSDYDELAICQTLERALREDGYRGAEARLMGSAPRLVRGLRKIILDLT